MGFFFAFEGMCNIYLSRRLCGFSDVILVKTFLKKLFDFLVLPVSIRFDLDIDRFLKVLQAPLCEWIYLNLRVG